MEFTLHYRGPLKSNGNPEHKHELRRHFHAQLKRLSEQRSPQEIVVYTGAVHFSPRPKIARSVGPFTFAPVICPEVKLVAELEITLLRPGPPGAIITSGGDIDNRLKTLLDSLKVPNEQGELPAGATPGPDESPFICLLADDMLITKVSVGSDRLLEPVTSPAEVILLIRVLARKLSDLELVLGPL